MAGGVVSLCHLFQALQPGEGGRIVFSALKNDADKTADVITELFRANVNSRAGNNARLFHFLYAYVNRTWTHAELFGQFGVSGARIRH